MFLHIVINKIVLLHICITHYEITNLNIKCYSQLFSYSINKIEFYLYKKRKKIIVNC